MLDRLTRLGDRSAFFDHFVRQVVNAHDSGLQVALLVIDVDQFGRINRQFGYQAGDRVLAEVGGAIRKVARTQDFVARIGDNRFAVTLPAVMNEGHALLAAHKIIRSVGKAIPVQDTLVEIGVTVGMSLCPHHGTHADHLVKVAEEAIRIAREKGSPVEVYPSADSQDLSSSWVLDTQLESALSRDEIELYYQPKINLRTRRVVGAEALMRWNSPSHGQVSPEAFIPIVERIGKIKPLTLWAINRALRQASEWSERWDELAVSVNVPASIVPAPDLPDLVLGSLNLWGTDRIRLNLEITESTLLADKDRSLRNLERIREQGALISIDDFGTGYSSLSYFKDIPADELKIDKSFVMTMEDDRASENIVAMIIHLAQRFGLETVAEGVETNSVLARLIRLRCNQVQGYLFGKPMSQEVFRGWLEEYHSAYRAEKRTSTERRLRSI